MARAEKYAFCVAVRKGVTRLNSCRVRHDAFCSRLGSIKSHSITSLLVSNVIDIVQSQVERNGTVGGEFRLKLIWLGKSETGSTCRDYH